MEAESESHVNRLSRELTALRLAQLQNTGASNGASVSVSPETRLGLQSFTSSPFDPGDHAIQEAMRRENEQLRARLIDTERDYIRISRLNEIYREELIEHRRRVSLSLSLRTLKLILFQLGMSVDNLIGLSSADPYAQPTHHRSSSSASSSISNGFFSPTSTSVMYASKAPPHGVPIPRPPSQIHRPTQHPSEGNTPLSHSPSSSESPLSPMTSTNPASYLSYNTNFTSPPSSSSFNPTVTFSTPSRGLSYPSVPPPSLSSSFGSPTVPFHMPHREHSPVEPLSRRNSNARRGSFERRVAETGSLRGISRSHSQSRRESLERGARVAETGSLVSRSRAESHSLPATTEAPDSEIFGTDDLDLKDEPERSAL